MYYLKWQQKWVIYIEIIQYVDDTLLIPSGDARILFNLKGLLRPFSDSTRLHVNFEKSFLVPINMYDRATHLAKTFGCKVGSMSFTYHGLPKSSLFHQRMMICVVLINLLLSDTSIKHNISSILTNLIDSPVYALNMRRHENLLVGVVYSIKEW